MIQKEFTCFHLVIIIVQKIIVQKGAFHDQN